MLSARETFWTSVAEQLAANYPPGDKTGKALVYVCNARAQGETYEQIGQAVGLSPGDVCALCRGLMQGRSRRRRMP